MRKILNILLFSLFFLITSCNYLDIVPDEYVKEENTYETPLRVKEYLYSCYSYLPTNRQISNNAYWMMCAGETSIYRYELFTHFNEGLYNPTNLHMTWENWSPIWSGIRQCYQFLDILGKTKNVVPEDLQHYRGEAKFLIAYYHFLSLRSYGPTLIMDHLIDQNDPIEKFPERSSYDEVVEFINQTLDEALPDLADNFGGQDYGRATKLAVWALKSRLYLYAASPLFNGNSEMYADFVSKIDGRHLISQEYSIEKWQRAADESKAAIDKLEAWGFRLYSDVEAGEPDMNKPGLPNKAQRRIRYSIMDYNSNPEVIWADTRREDFYDIQNRSAPRQWIGFVNPGAGCICPTLQTVESFYTKNGLPIDQDKTFDYENRYKMVELPADYDGNHYSDISNGNTIKLHLDREPRFYAWVGFHNGHVEVAKHNGVETNSDPAKMTIVVKLRNHDPFGKNDKDILYPITGYQNKKFVHPRYDAAPIQYPLSLFRMAELYLNYAEALVELDRLDEAKIYIDKVRERAGIPSIDDAWNNFSKNPGYQNTKEGLREIVRRERCLELYLEGHKFFDIRRWKIAEQFLGIPDKGLNAAGNTDEEFYQVVEIPLLRTFHKGQYLMPIDANEVNKMPQLVQNPYYN